MAEETKIIISAVDSTKAAFSSVQSGLGKVEGAAVTLNSVIGRLAPLLGAATFTAFVKNSIDAADGLDDLSQRTGVAVETLAGLELVAKLGDTSLDALAKGVNRLSIFMAENSERARELGITSKDSDEAFIQLSETLSGIEDVNKRNSIANEVLGKSYQELLPVLLQGGDSIEELIKRGQELNPVTSEMAKRAGMFNDQLDILRGKANQVGISLANDLLPSLNDIATAMLEASKETSGLYTLFIGFGGVADLIWNGTEAKQLKDRIVDLEEDIKTSRARLKALPGDPILEAIYGTKETKEALAKQEAELLASKSRLDQLLNPKRKETKEDPKNKDYEIKGNVGKSPAQTLQEQIALIQQENSLIAQGVPLEDAKTIARLKQQGIGDEAIVQLLNLQQETAVLIELEKTRADQKLQLIEDEKLFNEGDIRAIETEIELQNEQFDIEARLLQQQQLAVDAYDKMLESINQETEELQFQLSIQGLSKEAQQEKIDARSVEIALQKTLNDLAEQGLGLSAEEIDALREKYTELKKLSTKLEGNKKTAKDIGLTFKSGLEDAIVEGKKLSDVIKGIGDDILRILTRRAVTEPLTEAIDGIDFGKILGGIFGDAEANANGGTYSGPGISAYSGTVVSSPTLFPFAKGTGLMGEAGAEGIFPLKRGKDGKLGVSAEGAGGGASVSIVINNNGTSTKAEAKESSDARGNRRVEVTISDMVAGEVSRIGSSMNNSLRSTFGAQPSLVKR